MNSSAFGGIVFNQILRISPISMNRGSIIIYNMKNPNFSVLKKRLMHVLRCPVFQSDTIRGYVDVRTLLGNDAAADIT